MSGIQKTIAKKSQKKVMLRKIDNVSDSEIHIIEDIMIKQEENRVYYSETENRSIQLI